ncbi:uncharacterized protein DS421_1g14070 [Arachis hypogaea]|nr:uncharacterized protein DS421_1g14070 [Arachis hypogaea]
MIRQLQRGYLVHTSNTVMAHQAGSDGDINRLNETSHYVGAADFEGLDCMMNLEQYLLVHTLPPPDAIVPYLAEAGFDDTVPLRDFTFDNSLISAYVHTETPLGNAFVTLGGGTARHGDVGHGGAAAWCQASGGSTAGCSEEGVIHAEADLVV